MSEDIEDIKRAEELRKMDGKKCQNPDCKGHGHLTTYKKKLDTFVGNSPVQEDYEAEYLVCDDCGYMCGVSSGFKEAWNRAREKFFSEKMGKYLSDEEIQKFRSAVKKFIKKYKGESKESYLRDLGYWLAKGAWND